MFASDKNDARGLAMRGKTISERDIVVIVDDDENIRDALTNLLLSVEIETLTFSSTRDLFAASLPDRPGCMVLDVRLPGTSGLDLQAQLNAKGNHLPIVFLTGHGDVAMSVRAMKAGAIDFLTKPVRDQDLLDAVFTAIDRDLERRRANAEKARLAELAATLTPREHEVAAAVVRGLINKQIAFELGITEITVKLHRGNVMRKMQARSAADLVHKTQLAGLSY
jgi:FixJ family two-component response regulator